MSPFAADTLIPESATAAGDFCAWVDSRWPGEALVAPGRKSLSHGAWAAQNQALTTMLTGMGLEHGDAVALVMPAGAEAIAAVVAAMQGVACAPLNPASTAPELALALTRLQARLVVALAGPPGAAAAAAAAASALPVLRLEAVPDAAAGTLHWQAPPALAARNGAPSYPPDTVLLLFTSATTGHAKLVPWTRGALLAMMASQRQMLPEALAGRALIITPHFHLQCLQSVLTQTLSGGLIIATPGFVAERFLDWMRAYRPTNYTATPTLHRAILSICNEHRASELFRGLRFVTCAGAPLPDADRDELETQLGVRLIEGYGLTESGRVTMTPLDSQQRRAGSVGQCCGAEVGIMSEDGRLLLPGQVGEVVLRGDTVMPGYAHDAAANAEAFRDGWFRTGDLGRLDEDAFLYLVGRVKEAINRGGEKILPGEIEQALEQHPAVAEAAVFAFPHRRYGEDVGACIVRRGAGVGAADLRRFLAPSLADHKIPRLMLFVDEIPKGPTGKPQRAQLAELLGATRTGPGPSVESPLDDAERMVQAIWRQLLGLDDISRHDDFFLLGGDSLLAARMLVEVGRACGGDLGIGALAASATLASVADAAREASSAASTGAIPGLVRLQPRGDRPGLFLLPLASGDVLAYRQLVPHLGRDRPAYGLELTELQRSAAQPLTMASLASSCRPALRAAQQAGPYWLCGYSMAGLVALELARQLEASGETVTGVVLLDTLCTMPRQRDRVAYVIEQTARLPWRRRASYLARVASDALRDGLGLSLGPRAARDDPMGQAGARRPPGQAQPVLAAVRAHSVQPPNAPILLVWCQDDPSHYSRRRIRQRWIGLAGPRLDIVDLPGAHRTLVREPYVAPVAAVMLDYMNRHEG